jgi:oligopeptidase B
MTDRIKIYEFDADRRIQSSTQLHTIKFPVKLYTITGSLQIEFNSDILTFVYSSLITPTTTYAYDMTTKTLNKLYQSTITNYDKSHYITDIIYVKGTVDRYGMLITIPVTIAHKKPFKV